ncbi:hypothetical protein OIO90_004534 [Microbotryomycetes sp. JL221]|nr:hypothetical protein OIO90_004534 [Microbotryomycetes sp. JL221]
MSLQQQPVPQPPQQLQSHHQQVTPSSFDNLQLQLLLAQAVCQLGTTDWSRVAQLVNTSSFVVNFNQTNANQQNQLDKKGHISVDDNGCKFRFGQLLKASGLQETPPLEPNARLTRKVVRNLYAKTLHQALTLVHTRFKEERRISAEIDAIKAGKLDSQLIASAPPELRAKILASRASNTSATNLAPNVGKSVNESPTQGDALEVNDQTMTSTSKGDGSDASERDSSTKKQDQGDVEMLDASAVASPAAESSKTSKAEPDEPGLEDEQSEARQEDSKTYESAVGRRARDRADTVEEDSGAETPRAEGGEGEDGGESEAGDDQDDDDVGKRRARRKAGSATRTINRRNKRKTSEPATTPLPERSTKRVKTEDEQQAADSARFRKAITLLLSRLDDEPSINMFKQAVKRSDAPAYPDAVKRPMWLQQVVSRVKKGVTTNEVELMRDMALLCANAVQFNGKEDNVGKQAAELWTKFENMLEEHLTRIL